jgi:hypothetical protein
MCKWQMDDPEARLKSSLSDCTWLEDLSMELSSRHLRTYEAKRTEEHIYIYFTFILFQHVQVANRWSLGTCEVLVIGLHMVGIFEYGFVINALENLWSKKNRGASIYIYFYFYFISFSFLSLSFFLFLYSSFFPYFSFLLIIIFSFFIFFVLLFRTFCNIILT